VRAKAVGGGGWAVGAVKRSVVGWLGGVSTGCDARSGSLERMVRRHWLNGYKAMQGASRKLVREP
jgi:hypothetical protein